METKTVVRTAIALYNRSKHGKFEDYITEIGKQCLAVKQITPIEFTIIHPSQFVSKAIILLDVAIPEKEEPPLTINHN